MAYVSFVESGQRLPVGLGLGRVIIDLHHAVLIGVDYPDLSSAHTRRFDEYIVSPVAGRLELFDVP